MYTKKKLKINITAAMILLVSSCTTITRVNIYPVPKEDVISTRELPGSEIVSTAYNNREAKGLFLKKGERLVIIFHGNGGTVSSEIKTAGHFIDKGYSILIVEYPGYGVSKKFSPNENDIYDDAAALIQHVQRRDSFTPSQTTIYGRSLGAAVAVEMVRREFATKLICITPFTSMHDLVMTHGAPAFIEPVINDQNYDNLKKAHDIECPVLIVSGNADKKTPHWMARKLREVFPNCELLVIQSDKHATIYEDFTAETWQKITGF